MLEIVKMSLRVYTDAFDDELNMLIEAAQDDLCIAGVSNFDESEAAVTKAVVTYCKLHFGMPSDADRLQKSYDEQKAQLATHTGNTDWLED